MYRSTKKTGDNTLSTKIKFMVQDQKTNQLQIVINPIMGVASVQ